MGSGFIRRYQYFPGIETITTIEGVIIVDLPPPGTVNGAGVGTVALLGEFPDMTHAVAVDTSGNVATKPQPVEIFSGQDLLDKVGGFDASLGDTGKAGGNGFISLRNKKFSRLILVPINLASSKGIRMFRDLPTCKSVTDPTAAVLLSAGTVAAGREFKSGANRVHVGARKVFTALGAFKQAADGSVTAAGAPAPTQTFSSATGAFLTCKDGGPVVKGDILVLGVIGGAGALGANARTYRVAANPTLATQLSVEKLDGSTFDWTSGVAQPYRLHYASDADTGGNYAAADDGGYVVPARPLDATVAGATTISPTVVPPATTATSWDPLSGLQLRTIPTTGLVYTAAVQAANAQNDAAISALYSLAADSLLTDDLPAREANIVVAARHASAINTVLKAHVLNASTIGIGRMTCISPELDNYDTTDALDDSYPGVGANRAERAVYCWPGAQTFVPEASGISMKGADGLYYADGMTDTHLDMWMAATLSNLPPERNPGQASAPIPEILAPIAGFQRGVSGLSMGDYIQFRAKGIAALRFDRSSGPLFQSGVTTSLTSGEKNINRRRMADFIEDSLATRYNQFAKLPLTQSLKDSIVVETDAFLFGLKSPNNPPAQRINDYQIDDKSGNTPDLEARGIYVVIVRVRTLATADMIILQAEIGESVTITTT